MRTAVAHLDCATGARAVPARSSQECHPRNRTTQTRPRSAVGQSPEFLLTIVAAAGGDRTRSDGVIRGW